MPADDGADRLRAAREELAAAVADARDRAQRPAPARSGKENFSSQRLRSAPGTSGRPARDDPQPLGAAITRLLAERGWQEQAKIGAAFGRWEQIVGAELAAHTRPDGFAGGELVVVADSTAWATQLRLLAATLVRRLNAELGDGTVRRVKVRGPAGPARPRGAWRAPGGRGPRDTYG